MWILFSYWDYSPLGDYDIYGEYDDEQQAIDLAERLNEDDMDQTIYWVEGPFFGPMKP